MNEPHDVPDIERWAQSAQAAVTAIRNAGYVHRDRMLNDLTCVLTEQRHNLSSSLETTGPQLKHLSPTDQQQP